MDGAFEFQLGAFKDSFVPTASNAAQWASKWAVAATTGYNAGEVLSRIGLRRVHEPSGHLLNFR
jgi:hypothetical protein